MDLKKEIDRIHGVIRNTGHCTHGVKATLKPLRTTNTKVMETSGVEAISNATLTLEKWSVDCPECADLVQRKDNE